MPKPVGYRVLIEIPRKEETSKGGILLPEDMRKKDEMGSDTGIVRKIGSLCYQDDRLGKTPWVKEGDEVYYIRYAGIAIKCKDKLYRFINDEDIYGLVESGDRDE